MTINSIVEKSKLVIFDSYSTILSMKRFLLFFYLISISFSKAQSLTSEELIEAWSDSSLYQTISYHKTEQDLYKNFNNKNALDMVKKIELHLREKPDIRISLRLLMYSEAIFYMLNMKTDQYSMNKLKKAIEEDVKKIGDEQLSLELQSVYNEKDYTYDTIKNLDDKYKVIYQQEKIGEKYFPTLYRRHFYLSYRYYGRQDFNKTISHAKKGLVLLEKDKNIVDYKVYFRLLDLLGACYNEINQPEKGLYYYTKLDQVSNDFFKNNRKPIYYFPGDHNTFDWSIVAKGGIGQALILQNKCNDAKPLLTESYIKSHEQKEYYNEGKVLALLAQCDFNEGKYKEALTNYDKALTATNLTGADKNTRLKTLLGLSKTYKALGKKNASEKYFTKYIDEKNALKTNQDNPNETRQSEINKAIKTKSIVRLLGIFVVVGLIIIFLLVYLFRRYKKGAKLSLREKERKLKQKDILIEKTKEEQIKVQTQIKEFKNKLEEKSKLIEAIESQQVDSEELKALKSSTILTNEEWEIFKQKFIKFYPYFILKLIQKYPQLTTAEIRYLCLIKLNMSSSQIASTLGISPSSLRVTWYRIKKKIELSEQIQAYEFVEKNI
ncbi:tetratricopeptide repeat protein [Chryseobacterium sp. POL2]|uniref:transcriptional regulator n=1 Tax=Chryseobacterium sp. POL2 TaxID=2713414 RepID=UPI0013E1B1A9|nr:tetratricopeptide repeat protein [Chryseobacterium sp. POL2]QIG89573.1 tetratricopeptide repeat protein [Chryseobacterium sp. POL2]